MQTRQNSRSTATTRVADEPRLYVSVGGLIRMEGRWSVGILGGRRASGDTKLQAGPRSEELAGEASRASIASTINRAHETVVS